MMFQSRILRTKKRLSDEQWSITAVLVSLFGLLFILTYGLRVVTLPGTYGVIPLEIPVVEATIEDPGYYRYKETAHDMLAASTPMVVLTPEAFFFGDLTAFTSNFADARDKFIIRHIDGAPQLDTLVKDLNEWVVGRSQQNNIPLEKVLVLVPSGDIPMPIVIQVVAGLRTSPHFSRVILSSGLM